MAEAAEARARVGGLSVAIASGVSMRALRHRGPTGWLVAVGGGMAFGLIAGIQPAIAQGVVGGALLSTLICRAVLRRASAQRDGQFLPRVVSWAIALRGLFVIVHLAVALGFYGGMTDLGTYMTLVTESYDRIVAGEISGETFRDLAEWSIGNSVTVLTLVGLSMITGPTLWALFLVGASISLVGAYLYLRAFQRLFPDAEGERFLTYALFFLPAVGFWSTFLGKDFLSFFLIGWITYATSGLLRRVGVTDVLGLAISGGLFVLLRAHIAIPIVGAVGVALTLQLLLATKLPFFAKAIVAVGIAYAVFYVSQGSLLLLGFKEISVEALASQAEFVHTGFVNTQAGTALPRAIEDPSPLSVLKFLPFGLLTLVFRPFIWEAHNILAVAAGLENVFLVLLIVWRRRELARSLTSIFREPFLMYCLLGFLGAGVALSVNWNLGTMARHKTMIMPFLMLLLAGTRPRRLDGKPTEISPDLVKDDEGFRVVKP